MRITPSDQPSNSDLSYRAGRWTAVAIVRLAGGSKEIEMTLPNAILRDWCRRFEVPAAQAASPVQPMTFRSSRMDVAAIANFRKWAL